MLTSLLISQNSQKLHKISLLHFIIYLDFSQLQNFAKFRAFALKKYNKETKMGGI